MMITLFLLALFSTEQSHATVACGQEICPSFVNEFDGAFGYYEAISWCARDQCNPNINKETGEYGCYFGSPHLDGNLNNATNLSYLLKPRNVQSALGSGSVPNCNNIWRKYDQNIFSPEDRVLVLEFQHPCDKEKVGCRLTISGDGKRFSKVEKHSNLNEVKKGKERGMQNPAAAYVKGKKSVKKTNKTNNNPKGNVSGTDLLKQTDANNANKNNTATNNPNLGTTLLGTGNIDAAFNDASRLPSNAGAPNPDQTKKKACEIGMLDPGPYLHAKRLYVGTNYQYLYSGDPSIGNKGYECIGTTNLADASITELCQPIPQSIKEFKLLTDGRKGCVGTVQGERVLVIDKDSPPAKNKKPTTGIYLQVDDNNKGNIKAAGDPNSRSCQTAQILTAFVEALKSKASLSSFTCREYAPECNKYLNAARIKVQADKAAGGLSQENAKLEAIHDQTSVFSYASQLAAADCTAGR